MDSVWTQPNQKIWSEMEMKVCILIWIWKNWNNYLRKTSKQFLRISKLVLSGYCYLFCGGVKGIAGEEQNHHWWYKLSKTSSYIMTAYLKLIKTITQEVLPLPPYSLKPSTIELSHFPFTFKYALKSFISEWARIIRFDCK